MMFCTHVIFSIVLWTTLVVLRCRCVAAVRADMVADQQDEQTGAEYGQAM